MIKLKEAYIGLDSNSRPRVTQVGIIRRHYGETFSFGLPREIGDGV
jgi:hypothetical protein